jgi:hypothetical protein
LGWKPIFSPGEILASMVKEVRNVDWSSNENCCNFANFKREK